MSETRPERIGVIPKELWHRLDDADEALFNRGMLHSENLGDDRALPSFEPTLGAPLRRRSRRMGCGRTYSRQAHPPQQGGEAGVVA